MRPPLQKIAKVGTAVTKGTALFFILLIIVRFINDTVRSPYNIYIDSLCGCLFLYFIFQEIRKYSDSPMPGKYDRANLVTQNPLLYALMDSLQTDIDRFQNSVTYYFFSVRSFKYYTVILAGLSTVVLGLDLTGVTFFDGADYTRISKNIALVIGALITFLTTMAIYWNIEKYWLQNKIILQKFRELREEIEFADTKGPLTTDQMNEYFEKYKVIKKEFYKYWEGALAERNKQEG